ncbi:hypothetical protein ACJ41O_014221 [Fusarium nematophilum]
MAQAMITDSLTSTFRSERLLYRAVENTPETRRFINEMNNNPVNIALGELHVVRSANTGHTDWVMDQLKKADLGVIIYLEGPPDTSDSQEHQGTFKSSSTESLHMPTPTPIGYLSLGWGGRPPSQAHHRSASLGISLAAAHQGKGYGGEAVDWSLDWAFRLGGFHRVEAATVSYNERARQLYTRLGFVEEGRSREAYWFDRRWHDVVSYGVLEGEWAARRRKAKGT